MTHLVHIIDELRVGGAQTNLLVLLKNSKLKQSVVCLFGSGELENDIKKLGIPVHIFDFREDIRQRRFLQPYLELVKFLGAQRPSHVLCHLTWSRFLGLPAAYFAKIPNRFGFEHGDFYLNGLFFRIGNFVTQFFAKKIFVCSHFLAAWYSRSRWVFKNKIEPVHLGIDAAEFKGQARESAFRSELGFSDKTFLFCAVGTLGKGVNKRVDIIISAFGELAKAGLDVGLVVCGDGELRGELEKQAATLRNIKFLGTRRDISRIMANCDAFCHAAPFEPFGLVVIEAMLSGLPVIVPDRGGPSEITQGNKAGLTYRALDEKSLASAMRRLIEDESLRKALASLGPQWVKEKFLVQRYRDELFQNLRLST
jgi:glycosyltransferase involved in cell wall biosynthesis